MMPEKKVEKKAQLFNYLADTQIIEYKRRQ